MINLNLVYKDLLEFLDSTKPFTPEISFILGSGLGDFAGSLNCIKSISTKDLIGYPNSTVVGHQGKIHFAEYENKKVLLFQGRIHFYEGYSIYECVLPVLISNYLGCKKIILTNAAGGINSNFNPGDLMLISSLISFNIKKEISTFINLPSIETKNKMLDFPSSKLNSIILQSAMDEKISLKEGVYYFGKGPSYETPAEIQMFKKFGADAVGMSTAHEALYAASVGMEVSAISCITNLAAGISKQKLSHQEVTETANKVKDKFERLLKRVISLA